jgi:hypothetical protein
VLGWLITLVTLVGTAYQLSMERVNLALILAAMTMYFLVGTLLIPAIGPSFLASRADAVQSAKKLIEAELRHNPALRLEHMRRLADNERHIRSSAEIIWAALEEVSCEASNPQPMDP